MDFHHATDDEIRAWIHERAGTLKANVHYLLIKIPGTRGDDELLSSWYRVIFTKQEIYDYDIHAFRSAPITPSQIVKSVKTESIGRLRRYLQEEDKQLYHRHHEEWNAAKGKMDTIYETAWLTEHACVLPSYQLQLRHSLEASESRVMYASKRV